MGLQHVRISELVEGGKSNPRKAKSSFDALKASIPAAGLIQKLVARRKSDTFEIIAGNRRLRALRALAEEGIRYPGQPGDDPDTGEAMVEVFVVDADDDAVAQEIALAENVVREDLHPVDEYEAFARLRDEGHSAESIASRFAISTRGVRQRLALGGLHPQLREAWRAGKLRSDTAAAFTMITDTKRQKQVFDDLSKRNDLWSNSVRAAAGVNYEAAKALKVVGAEAYRAAGGEIVEDLFGEQDGVSDPALAKRLLVEKIEATCRELEADGWSFALPRDGVQNWYTWPKQTPKVSYKADERKQKTEASAIVMKFDDVEAEDMSAEDRAAHAAAAAEIERIDNAALLRAFKPDLRKKSGCFVWADGDGIQIQYGVQRPAQARKEPTTGPADGPDADTSAEAPQISAAVAADLSSVRTVIAAQALEGAPQLALALLVATLECGFSASPLRITARGMPDLTPEVEDDDDEEKSFADLLGGALNSRLTDLLERAATVIARGLDMRVARAVAEWDEDHNAVVAAIKGAEWRRIAEERFDAQGYFSRIPVPLIVDSLKEMLGPDYSPKGKKADLVAAAVAQQKETRWLPPLLRHPSEIDEEG